MKHLTVKLTTTQANNNVKIEVTQGVTLVNNVKEDDITINVPVDNPGHKKS